MIELVVSEGTPVYRVGNENKCGICDTEAPADLLKQARIVMQQSRLGGVTRVCEDCEGRYGPTSQIARQTVQSRKVPEYLINAEIDAAKTPLRVHAAYVCVCGPTDGLPVYVEEQRQYRQLPQKCTRCVSKRLVPKLFLRCVLCPMYRPLHEIVLEPRHEGTVVALKVKGVARSTHRVAACVECAECLKPVRGRTLCAVAHCSSVATYGTWKQSAPMHCSRHATLAVETRVELLGCNCRSTRRRDNVPRRYGPRNALLPLRCVRCRIALDVDLTGFPRNVAEGLCMRLHLDPSQLEEKGEVVIVHTNENVPIVCGTRPVAVALEDRPNGLIFVDVVAWELMERRSSLSQLYSRILSAHTSVAQTRFAPAAVDRNDPIQRVYGNEISRYWHQ